MNYRRFFRKHHKWPLFFYKKTQNTADSQNLFFGYPLVNQIPQISFSLLLSKFAPKSLRLRDNSDRPKDLPPALPSRPPSRARIRLGRWSAQPNFNTDSNSESGGEGQRKENELRVKRNTFWNKKRRKDVNADSPYNVVAVERIEGEERMEETGVLEGSDNIGYFIKKSKAGPILIAVNPFKDVQINGKDIVTSYKQKATDKPHVFAIAENAYNELMNDGVNQSLMISGKSGAGKTETAKFAVQYLAALGGGNVGIECQILQTSCILEAFGNSKTSMNVKSSRFVSSFPYLFKTVL
ncbi:myosin-2-like isoform X1 [Gossypium arboreum]|uniref:Myosin motor domain-containing protein n=2 Tax=Gossypium arboreum TaxID=29729 RepID=A0ABR0Q2S0_GOSAR|nr:myosin-2-like isoform X1 [Gossypium arboreum]KAK5833634.1 hypothetical protein PVK06_017487 [Gossypium arboreum]